MSNTPAWKLAVIALVAIITGVALLLADWTLPQLAAFVAMFFVARGALHIVTTSFEDIDGALAVLQGGGELAVGLVLLAWPSPPQFVLAVVVGSWVIVRGIVVVTIELATRHDQPHWRFHVVSMVLEVAVGITLVARPRATVHGTAITLAVLAILSGAVEIVAAIGRGRAERRLQRPARVRTIGAS